MASCARLCTLMVHTTSHFAEDLMLNSEIFADYAVGEIVQIFDPDRPNDRLVLKVQSAPSSSVRVEISLSKVVAESLNFKPFVKVIVEKISEQEASISFVEFVFKRQYLQRGNMWRFKTSMFGRPVYMGQNVSTNGMQAQILQLRNKTASTTSGIITEKTKFVFRSRSSRIIWLVQISAEMWEFDQNGVLYFEKFLSEFVSPILDSWKALGVSHMLTVVFFSRTLYLERINATTHPDLYGKKSLLQNSDGLQYQDYYRIVLENIADIDKVAHIKKLRQEFWAYPRVVDWKIVGTSGAAPGAYSAAATPAKPLRGSPDSLSLSAASADEVEAAAGIATAGPLRINTKEAAAAPPPPTANASNVNYAVPSDAVHGNFLEAINTSLNILDKHYMDRDLTRTGNAIVMISAGSGIFKVKPVLAQITKQRMIDGGIGLDFISLSRPSVNVVPLFLVDCRSEGVKDFYETPYWIRVSYVDCHKEISANLDSTQDSEKENVSASENPDKVWAKGFMPQPISTLLTAQLMNSGDLKTLAKSYANALPMALKELLLNCANVVGADIDNRFSPNANGGFYDLFKNRIHFHDGEIPIWGKVPNDDQLTRNALTKLSGRAKATTGLNDLPILKRDRADSSVVDSQSSSLMVDDDMIMMEYQRSSRTGSRDEFDFEDKIIDDFEFNKATNKGQHAILNKNENRTIAKSALSISASVSTESLHSAVVHFDNQAKQQSGHTPVHRKHTITSQQSLEYTIKQTEILASLASVALVAGAKQQLLDLMNQHDDIVARAAFRAKGSEPPTPTPIAAGTGAATPAAESVSDKTAPGSIPIPAPSTVAITVSSSGSYDAASKVQQADARNALRPAPIVIDGPEPAVAPAIKKATVSPRMSALAARNNPTIDRRKMMMMSAMGAQPPQRASMGGPGVKSSGSAAGNNSSGPHSHASQGHHNESSSSALVVGSLEDKSLENQLKNDPSKRFRLTNKNFVSKSQTVSNTPRERHSVVGTTPTAIPEKSKTAVGGAGGGNQEWMIQHGKIIPLPPSKNKTNEERIKLIREYCDVTCINPFRPKEGLAYLQSITHNRRRWSHVFPSGAHEYHVDYGLNWKSLTQPAILPINTDYMPNVAALVKGYDVQNFYQLLIDKHECPFPNPECLMQEMIASRVTREFQLIEGIDVEPFIKFNKHNIAGGGNSSRAVVPSALRREKATPAHVDLTKNKTFFILSMGHRIQFLDYDAENSQVNVTQYRSKKGQNNDDESNTYTYHYELWTPQSNRFQSMTQSFYQFPNPELKWNKIDNIIMGNIPFEAVDDGTKARRLRYTIFPEPISAESQVDDYFSKLDQLFEFLGKYNNNSETIHIKKHRDFLEFSEMESQIDEWMASSYSSIVPINTIPVPITLLGGHARSNSGNSAIGSRSGGGGTLTPQSLSRVGSGIPSMPPGERGIALNGLSARSNSGTIHFPSLSATSSRVNVLPPASGSTPPATPANVPSTNSLDNILLSTVTATPTKSVSVTPTAFTIPTPPSPTGTNSTNGIAVKNPLAPRAISLYQKATTYPEVLKMNMKAANKENPNWMYMVYEHDVYTYKTYHLEFHWLVCDSWLIDEFIQLLFRRCHKFGLRLCQTPEYFSTPNLNIHPFRAQPYIVVPTIANIPWEHSSEVRLIERLYFRRSVGWLYDTEQITDWNGLGVPVPNYDERDRDIRGDPRPGAVAASGIAGAGSSASSGGSTSARPVVSSLSKSLEQPSPKPTAAGAAPVRVWGKTRNNKDRQYILHMGLATVRVAAQGFIWLSNASAKISDININAEEKKEITNKKMLELDRFCHVAVACYEVVLDIVTSAINIAEAQSASVTTASVSDRSVTASPCPTVSGSESTKV